MSESESTVLTDRIGLVGVLALVIGNAVSIPIFVLPGPLTAQAGPSVVLATLVAAVPAVFVVLYNAQLGSAMPVAGGLYVYISRLTAPFWGFLVPFTLPIVNWAGLLFTAIGFAEYVRFFVDVPANLLIYGFLVGVVVINLVGIKTVAKAQVLFVLVLFASIVTFVIPGLFAIEPANYATPFPNGVGPFGIAVVALYYPYLGFGLLTEIGEEIDNPGKIIPLALFSGVTIVAAIYLTMVAVVAGVLPHGAYEGVEAGVAVAAQQFLPPWAVAFVAGGALFAVATSVNTSLLVSSRTVMRAGRDGVLPEALSRIHPRFQTPYVSILMLGVPPIVLAVFIQQEVVELSVFIALAVLTAAFFSALALWNLPVEFPDHYENAALKLRRYRGLLVAVVGGALVSALLWTITLVQLPGAGLLLFGWFFLGYLYYRYRIRIDDRAGGGLYMKMVSLEAHEDAFATAQSYDDAIEQGGPTPVASAPASDGGAPSAGASAATTATESGAPAGPSAPSPDDDAVPATEAPDRPLPGEPVEDVALPDVPTAPYDPDDGILVVDDLRKEFGGLTAVDDLSFAVREGEILGFIGPNGAGKSTTFNCITGAYPPTGGTVYYRGEDVTGLSSTEMTKTGLARTFQDFKPLEDRTVVENVQLALVPDELFSLSGLSGESRRKAELICERVGLGDRLDQTPGELPHAGLLRLELGRALATDPDLLLVDEPFAGLSNTEVEEVSEIFYDLRDAGLTLVVVDHNMRGLLDLIDRAFVITFGSKIAEGPPEEITDDPQVQEAYLGGDEI